MVAKTARQISDKQFLHDIWYYYNHKGNWDSVGERMGRSGAYAWKLAHEELQPSTAVKRAWYRLPARYQYRPVLPDNARPIIERIREKGYNLVEVLTMGEAIKDVAAIKNGGTKCQGS